MECPGENTIEAFMDGRLAEPGRDRIHAHVDRCPDCRALIAQLARVSVADSAAPTEPEQDDGDEPRPGATIGRFVVERRVGAGGMGVVYAAHDPTLARTVAVKVVRRGPDAATQELVLREAQALARLSHPNVVAVHEVGRDGGRVFIAMELVVGRTLRQWLAERPRGYREVVAIAVQAGRGLEAAHRAGLVHRDFKPDNVLIDSEERAKVTDFGLAFPIGKETGSPAPVAASTLCGTPAYMAPEQRRGERATARSDQYSFCLTVVEALAGRRPDPVGPAALRDVTAPSWLRRILATGMAEDPAARHASMAALVDALVLAPYVRRTLAVVAVLAAAAFSIALITSWAVGSGPAPCSGAVAHLAGAWDAERRDAVQKAFGATGRPYAASTFAAVATTLDDYAARWIASHTDACEATHVRGEQPAAVLDARTHCLSERRRELRALVDRFARADPTVLERASEAARLLPAAESCDREAALAQVPLLPSDPAVRRQVEELGAQLAEARALRLAGLYAQARDAIRALLAPVLATGHRPLEATARYELARAQAAAGELQAAQTSLASAALAAEAGRQDHLAARIAIRRLRTAVDLAQLGEFDALLERARAWVERLGSEAELEADLFTAEASVFESRGQWEAALERRHRALDLYRRLDLHHASIPSTLLGVARLVTLLGRYTEAIPIFGRVLSEFERTRGRDHPDNAGALNGLASAYVATDRFEEAARTFRQAITLTESKLGPDHPELARLLVSLAYVQVAMQQYDDAIGNGERALSIMTRADGPLPEIARVQTILAGALSSKEERLQDGADMWQMAITSIDRSLGPDHAMMAGARNGLAGTLRRQGKHEEALWQIGRVLAAEKTLPSPKDLARALRTAASIHLALGRLAEARAHAERALDLAAKADDPDNIDVAEALSQLATVDRRERRYADGRARLERAVPIVARVYGGDHPFALSASANLADMFLGEGEAARALEIYRRVQPAIERLDGADNPDLVGLLTPMAQALEKLGHTEEARRHLERALAMASQANQDLETTDMAEIRFSLARVLGADDRGRALTLARKALAAYRAAGSPFKTEAGEVRAWLRARGSR